MYTYDAYTVRMYLALRPGLIVIEVGPDELIRSVSTLYTTSRSVYGLRISISFYVDCFALQLIMM
jgi:hypothetical protein